MFEVWLKKKLRFIAADTARETGSVIHFMVHKVKTYILTTLILLLRMEKDFY